MHVRAFRSDDAPALARLFYDAVHQLASSDYSPDQLNAWAPAVPAPKRFVEWGADGRMFFVAVNDEDAPIAFGDVEADGHIDHLFCRPDAAGTGVTSALYDHMEAAARQRGISRVHVEASEPARRFFLRKGFALLHRRQLVLNGVAIHNYAMEKRLVR